ncbi:MAG: SDR family oxidoreductase [Litoreibacter sp.]|nr:SDR family oxidoreductase [Litoreibacter sp.]
MLEADTAMLTPSLPALRGKLATPSGAEGRFDMPLLRLAEGDADVVVGDVDAAQEAFASGRTRVSVEGVGIVELLDAPQGDLSGQVAIVTGGAGGLGLSVAEELVSRGAKVALCDIADGPVRDAAERLGGIGITCDVTDPAKVNTAVQSVVDAFGGVDILISNAGSAQQGALLELEDDRFQKAFDLNFWSHHYVARSVVRVMKAQGTGGSLVFNVSKQAVNPGPNFGAYGAPKAALMALMRQYAVEHGADGITANAVNADRIRTGLMTDEMIEARCKARGLTPDEYMRGNLVKREVTGKDVAEAFVFLARARTSTGAVMTVDGGNVAAMMR